MRTMKSPSHKKRFDIKKRFAVVLVHPDHPENIGLVARNMKNTGFEELRIVRPTGLEQKAYKTAVHAADILEKAKIYSKLSQATEDLDLVFASTSKKRKNFPVVPLDEAVKKMFSFPPSTRIGLLFGNERTGLTSEELRSSNFCFTIPQVSRQPSYNLASAVVLTLFHVYSYHPSHRAIIHKNPLSRKDQENCISLILEKLDKRGFIHRTNRLHMTEMIHDLFGRLALTEKDKRLLLALFSKATNE